jgi:NAD(P)-dependent dehydrogenase (short-subunit alcohol dehydrogenase family)
MNQVWFITGASRGIGADIAKAALDAGHKVVATSRNYEDVTKNVGVSDQLLAVSLDVTNKKQIDIAVQQAISKFGSIDVLVNNAGYGHLGIFEETSLEDIHKQFNTNVFGLMAVTHAVLPHMRKQRGGRIFNISSVAGLKAGFATSIYGSSKFAVEGFSQALAEEVSPFNVFVTCVSPGYFRTDFLDTTSVKYSNHHIEEYTEGYEKFNKFHKERNHSQPGDPVKLGQVLVKLAQEKKPPVSFVAGSDGVQWANNAVKTLQSQVDEWKDLSVITDGEWAK